MALDQITTNLDRSFERFEDELLARRREQGEVWPEEQRAAAVAARRKKRCLRDFWQFDLTYFPPESHPQGWSPPGHIHRRMLELSETPGLHWVIAHRDFGKTAYLIKILLWKLVRGDVHIAAVYAHDLMRSRKLVRALHKLLTHNGRVRADFSPRIITLNDDELRFTIGKGGRERVVQPFSEDRSVKGANELFARPEFLAYDDVENSASSLRPDIVEARVEKLVEAWKSLAAGAAALGVGNAHSPDCASARLLKEQNAGAARDHIRVHRFPAWSESRKECGYKGSPWKERYPAASAREARDIHRISSEVEWSQAQCRPVHAGGLVFPLEHYAEYDTLPGDAKGVAWCDPNLAKKAKGDTTAMATLLYSAQARAYFVHRAVCRSFSDPNDLLDTFLSLRDGRVLLMGMDGNVTQESTWSAFIEAWSFRRGAPFPPVQFGRWRADDHAVELQTIWHQGNIRFPRGFTGTAEGAEFRRQVTQFISKKAGRKDDAPDALICALQLLFSIGVRPSSPGAARGVWVAPSKTGW